MLAINLAAAAVELGLKPWWFARTSKALRCL